MIIACPACTTRYVVPDSSIGVEGRTVRCAKCRHSWFQEGPEPAAPAPPPLSSAPPATAPEQAPAPAPAPPPEPAPRQPEPEPEPQGFDEPVEETPPPPPPPPPAPVAKASAQPPLLAEERPRPSVYSDDDTGFDEAPSSFAHEPPFRPRRNPARMWTLAAAVFAVVSLGAIGAVSWYGLPDWAPFSHQTFAEAQPGLVLDFPAKRQDRRTLPNGTEYFGASGTVRNVGREKRTVPPILVVLRDSRGRIAYSWEIISPKPQLAPGESVTIHEAMTDVPKSARSAEIGWKPGA